MISNLQFVNYKSNVIQGVEFQIQALPYSIYTTMYQVDGKDDQYSMTGMFADIWFELQVRNISIIKNYLGNSSKLRSNIVEKIELHIRSQKT